MYDSRMLFLAILLNLPVAYYRLPNGLKVVVSESHTSPTVPVAVYYGVGFRVEPKGQTGFAHLFEHMMFQGSAHVRKFEHAKIVESVGGNLNASTPAPCARWSTSTSPTSRCSRPPNGRTSPSRSRPRRSA